MGIQPEARPLIGGLRAVSVAVLLCVATVSAGLAQGMDIGVNLGLTRSSFDGDSDLDSGTGFSIGVVFGCNLSKVVAVHPEVVFVRKGASGAIAYRFDTDPTTGDFIEETWEETFDLDYLDLQAPIAVALPTGRSGALKPRFYAGPAVAFETSCEAETVIHLDVYSGTTGERLDSETRQLALVVVGDDPPIVRRHSVRDGVEAPVGKWSGDISQRSDEQLVPPIRFQSGRDGTWPGAHRACVEDVLWLALLSHGRATAEELQDRRDADERGHGHRPPVMNG